MKKLLCLLFAFTVIFSFIACKQARLEYWEISESSDSYSENSADISYESSGDVSENTLKYTSTPLMWKVTGGDSDGTIWLFGSMHIADKTTYPLPNAILEAFNSCDNLAVECDITKNVIIPADFYESITYPDDTTIDQYISPDIYEAASALVSEYYGEDSIEVLARYKPVYWYLLTDGIIAEKSKLSQEYGLDIYFLELANDEDKEILEIESVNLQYKMLSGFSDELQEFLLAGTVFADEEMYLDGLDYQYEAWKNGDVDELEELIFPEPPKGYYTQKEIELIDEYNKEMIYDRNEGMVDVAIEYLDEDMEVFYVVGLAHMLGEQGIVQMLADAGNTVEQITSYSYDEV
ncbi:MAG TPA: hypothetical protein DD733_06445 [Clostridiales bacterium]|nr:hypothetical protein [Clostridiales bacterium]